MNFPQTISFTITNACNLRCKMCGQWSDEGYMHKNSPAQKKLLTLTDWKRLTDEIASHNISSVIIRGGEPFLFPGIIELLRYINSKGIFISIDTNGTLVKKFASEIVRIGKMHLTFSVDGTEEIHDKVRGLKGCFKIIKESIESLIEAEKNSQNKISRGICFTISPYSIKALGKMPDVARSLSVNTLVIVPYYYVPLEVGDNYEKELKSKFNSTAFSWQGFHHEGSGINFKDFIEELHKYKDSLDGIYDYPYLKLSEEEYHEWFSNTSTLIGSPLCSNTEKLIDIQPDGSANFCVDFPDFSFGNVRDSTIETLWNSERAEQFRDYRRKKLLPVCYRCGAKFMSETVS
jgi:MoaA/NifB/PqqE/SkfB family radical SAM enzyme